MGRADITDAAESADATRLPGKPTERPRLGNHGLARLILLPPKMVTAPRARTMTVAMPSWSTGTFVPEQPLLP